VGVKKGWIKILPKLWYISTKLPPIGP